VAQEEVGKVSPIKNSTQESLIPPTLRAVDENPANVPMSKVWLQPRAYGPQSSNLALIGRRWEIGRTLRIRFLDVPPEVQSRVEEYAHQWSHYAHIKFELPPKERL
jgi:hypothetical protein